MAKVCHLTYPSTVFPPRRVRSANDQSLGRLPVRHSLQRRRMSLPTGPPGGAWPSTTTREGVFDYETTLLYCRRRVKPAGSRKVCIPLFHQGAWREDFSNSLRLFTVSRPVKNGSLNPAREAIFRLI
jgi:hypothetical protein